MCWILQSRDTCCKFDSSTLTAGFGYRLDLKHTVWHRALTVLIMPKSSPYICKWTGKNKSSPYMCSCKFSNLDISAFYSWRSIETSKEKVHQTNVGSFLLSWVTHVQSIPHVCHFSPLVRFVSKFFFTQKCVNPNKRDFAAKQHKCTVFFYNAELKAQQQEKHGRLGTAPPLAAHDRLSPHDRIDPNDGIYPHNRICLHRHLLW